MVQLNSEWRIEMEKVLGIGYIFFRARDPKVLAAWCRDHLGVDVVPDK